jgi:hypothetical protein
LHVQHLAHPENVTRKALPLYWAELRGVDRNLRVHLRGKARSVTSWRPGLDVFRLSN